MSDGAGLPGETERLSFPIGRKLACVFGVVVGLLVVAYLLVISDVRRIRKATDQLVKESAEAANAGELLAAIDGLVLCSRLRRGKPEPTVSGTLKEYVDVADQALSALQSSSASPGAETVGSERQARDQQSFTTIGQDLARMRAWFEDESVPVEPEVLDRVVRAAKDLERSSQADAESVGEAIKAETSTMKNELVLFVVLSGALLVGALILIARQVVRPLRVLQRSAEAFGRGRLDARLDAHARDEIGSLGRTFNQMAARIAVTHGDLEHRVKTRTQEFVRAAKLADVGALAAGIAHEINNPLASIASCAEGLVRRMRRGAVDVTEQATYLETIAHEAYRAKETTARLLALARTDPGPTTDVDLRTVLGQVELIVRHQMESRRIALETDVAPGLPSLHANANEIKQVLVNLLLNARDASPEGGQVVLRCRAEAGCVAIDVEDQGKGIAAENLDRVFDPFFTTKEPGRGTGLGLALALAIVEGHGGTLRVENQPGGGARFQVRLPLVGAEVG